MKFRPAALALVAFLSLFASSTHAWIRGSATLNNGGAINLNVSTLAYYGGINILLNWRQIGETTLVSSTNGTLTGRDIWDCPSTPSTCGTPTTYMDPTTGELASPTPADVTSYSIIFYSGVASSFAWNGITNPFLNQIWDVTWTGANSSNCVPSVTGTLGSGGSSSFAAGTNAGTITFGSTAADGVSLVFTPNATCRSNPPRSIWISQRSYASDVTACKAGTRTRCFNPDWLADVRSMGVLRLMDFSRTNASGITELSQFADWDYSRLSEVFPSTYGLGSLSGTTFTATSTQAQSPYRIGTVLTMEGATTNKPTITAFVGGTGGDGTYTVSCPSGCPTLSSRDVVGAVPVGSNYTAGPKGSIHPNIACALGQATGAWIEFPMPTTISDQGARDALTVMKNCTGVRWKVSYSNEMFNNGFYTANHYALAYQPTNPMIYQGYRATQIAEIAADVFGTKTYHPVNNPTSRWWGAIGTFNATPSYSQQSINGANSWISGGSVWPNLTDLIWTIDTAPYLGQYNTGGTGATITGVTVSATPTVTQNSHGYTNGQVIRMFVSGGTMASVLNNVYATVSSAATNTYQINISTTGLTYASAPSGLNYSMDGALFKLIDQSISLNGSTPATYPNAYSYFGQQYIKAILNGSASDASYGTITVGSDVNLTSSGILSLTAQHALTANTYGLTLSHYEGGWGPTLSNQVLTPEPTPLAEYYGLMPFYPLVTGDSTYTMANLYATSFNALWDNYGVYPSQYNDISYPNVFGAYGILRYIPGNESNPKYQALVTQNASGARLTPTYPSAPGTYSYLPPTVANANESTADTTYTYSASGFPTGSSFVSLCYASQTGAATLSALEVGGVSVTLTQDAINTSSGLVTINSGTIPAGTATRTVKLTFGSSLFNVKAAYLYNLSGLNTNAKETSTNGSGASNIAIDEKKGAAIIGCARWFSGTPNWGAGASNVLAPVTQNTAASNGSSALFVANFPSTIFPVTMQGASGSVVGATYR